MILGIDEVGRGPWAGPLVVGAVVLPHNHTIQGLTDSKKLTKRKREQLSNIINEQAVAASLGWVSARELDSVGLSCALNRATIKAVKGINAPYDQIIIDGTINFLHDTAYNTKVSTLKKADLIVPEVSAASIIAKVARDNYMQEKAQTYTGYGFETNVGYGTKAHSMALELYGITPLHRQSFSPIKKYLLDNVADKLKCVQKSTSKSRGDKAERAVVEYLINKGHTIVVQNFKTKSCEIDIVSKKGHRIYFTEVKYRKNTDYGGSIEAITFAKKRQMKYAAELFLSLAKAQDVSIYEPILAAGFVGDGYSVEDWFILE